MTWGDATPRQALWGGDVVVSSSWPGEDMEVLAVRVAGLGPVLGSVLCLSELTKLGDISWYHLWIADTPTSQSNWNPVLSQEQGRETPGAANHHRRKSRLCEYSCCWGVRSPSTDFLTDHYWSLKGRIFGLILSPIYFFTELCLSQQAFPWMVSAGK